MAKKGRSEKDKLGAYLCLLLRHKPEAAGLTLDRYGYANIAELMEAVNKTGRYHIDLPMLMDIVANDDKRRYAYSPDGLKIRACQGHSIPVELDLKPVTPPDLLYHGTAARFLESILSTGLQRGKRMYVHLSADSETARKVGARHGEPVIFLVDTAQMQADGFPFYQADNGVWLCDYVPREYLHFIDVKTEE